MNSTKHIDIATFLESHGFYGRVELMLTIKSFDLEAIRERYLASRANKSGRAGSVERRPTATGGIARVVLENGRLTEQEVLCKLQEPRGIDIRGGWLALAAENKVYVLDGERTETIEHPWFSYIHTVAISRGGHHILISSSGFDAIFDWSMVEHAVRHEWFAWDYGFDTAVDPETGEPLKLTRNPLRAKQFEEDGIACRLIQEPEKQVLPTAQRAAFINSVVYDGHDPAYWLATFFHEGAVYRINPVAGVATPLITGLKNPHGGRVYLDGYMATSTASGEIMVLGLQEETRYDFSALPGKPEALQDMEWLQNAIPLGSLVLAIDTNRTAFHIIDPKQGLRDTISFPENWAIQDMAHGSLTKEVSDQLRALG